jgi:ATP-dependent protease HslVU (ClpYQ) peptidase subunit
MSTVVVVKKDNRACIAGDTLVSFGDMKQQAHLLVGMSKIIQVNDAYLAVVGSSAHQMVLQSYFAAQADEMDFSSRQAIFESWRKMHRVLKEEYHLNSEEDREDPYQSTQVLCLLMNEHGIFGVYPMRSVAEYTKFWAMGSGSDYALGAMQAVYDDYTRVEDIASAGLHAAAEFDKSTALPLTMHTIEMAWEPLPVYPRLKALAAYAM